MMAMTLCIQVTSAKNESETTGIHGIKVKNLTIERNADSVFIDMTIDFTSLDIATTELAVFTPYVKSEKDSLSSSGLRCGRQPSILNLSVLPIYVTKSKH